jgi:hypothetical protein
LRKQDKIEPPPTIRKMMAQTNFRASDMSGAAKASAPTSKATKKAPAPKKAEAPVVEEVVVETPAEESE